MCLLRPLPHWTIFTNLTMRIVCPQWKCVYMPSGCTSNRHVSLFSNGMVAFGRKTNRNIVWPVTELSDMSLLGLLTQSLNFLLTANYIRNWCRSFIRLRNILCLSGQSELFIYTNNIHLKFATSPFPRFFQLLYIYQRSSIVFAYIWTRRSAIVTRTPVHTYIHYTYWCV